jgi:hypothetical protein
MNHQTRTVFRFIPALLLAGCMAAFNPAQAAISSTAPAKATHLKEAATARAKQQSRKRSAGFNADAVSAIKEVEQAASLLQEKKYDAAVKKLESADGKLEIAMASNPDLKLIPVAEDVISHDLMTNPETVKQEVTSISEELMAGNVQDARVQLDRLRSDLITRDVYLPVETYPAAIKQAVKQLTAKQYQQAADTLDTAMDSLVEEIQVQPLPVILAHDAIQDAQTNRTSDREQAMWDLDFAHEQMLTAKRLGYFYGDTKDYKSVVQHIEKLREAMGGKSEVDQLFTKAKQDIGKLIGKFSTAHPSPHSTTAGK